MTELEHILEENERLRTEVAYLKKVEGIALEGRSLTAQKAETVRELVSGGFRLDLLLKTAKLARSTKYYQLKWFNRANKDEKVKEMIQIIYVDIRVTMVTVVFI